MKKLVLIFMLCLVFFSCEKERNRRALGAYFKFTLGGVEKKFEDGAGLYDNTFDCYIYSDTMLIIDVRTQYEGAGLIVKGHPIADGTYSLDTLSKGYYTNPDDNKRYYTDSSHTGTLTIKKGTFEAASTLNTLEGSFSYSATDTATGKTFTLTNGTFLMERHHE